MKRFLLTAATVAFSKLLFAQRTLHDFNVRKKAINQKGFIALGSWSAANIVYGSIAANNAQGSTKSFHQMNAMWNAVTLGIVSVGYFSGRKNKPLDYAETLRQQASVEKLFLLNAGLDVAYMAGGFYLRERSKTNPEHADRNKGFGQSIIFQGAVLLAFDAIMYGIHQHHGKQLYKLAESVEIAATPNGVGIVAKL